MSEPQEHRASRRRSREEADRLVMEFEQSGLTRQVFFRRHGLALGTLDNYRKRRACGPSQVQAAAPATTTFPAVTFVPVELIERSLIEPASMNTPMAGNGAGLYLDLVGGRRIGVTAGFDAATLTRLIAVLEA